jgi:septum formation topological specificity factor MinE
LQVHAGVDPVIVAKTTKKHKEVLRVLSKYIHEDDNIKLAFCRAIGKRILENH